MTKLEVIKKIKDPLTYLEHFIKIRDKKGSIIPFKLNQAQVSFYKKILDEQKKGRPVRIVILKARQLGFSTLIEALFFQLAATGFNVRTLIVAHDTDSTSKLFRMNKLFYDKLPALLRPMKKNSNAKEILFENPTKSPLEKQKNPGLMSSIKCVPATGSSVGRGDTLNYVHASEVAFWGDITETLTALLQAVPDEPNTMVVLETTANGYNAFKDFWDKATAGENGFLPVFYPWYLDQGYRRTVPPDTVWTDEELRLKESYKLEDEQLAWRRWCIATNFNGDSELFKQEYPSCPEEAFLMSGTPYFDNAVIVNRLMTAPEPIRVGRYEYEEADTGQPINWHFVDCKDGEIKIYKNPDEYTPYVAGGDTAGDGSDRFTAYMLDNTSGSQVVEILYSGSSELYYSQQLYCLGMDYNEALLGVEINYSTYPEKKLEEWQYPALYIRAKPDDSRDMLEVYKLGFKTDLRTRPLILAGLHTIALQNIEMINSEDLLREMLSFVRNKDMRPEAAPGMHDDLVMACAIANYIRPQQSFELFKAKEEPQVKLIDRLDPKRKHRKK